MLLLSLLIFAIGYVALSQPKLFAEGLRKGRSQTQLTPASADSLQQRLSLLMENEKPFLQDDLKIGDLADQLGLPVHHLSELLNDQLHTNFADYINQYRIDAEKISSVLSNWPKAIFHPIKGGISEEAGLLPFLPQHLFDPVHLVHKEPWRDAEAGHH